MDKIEKTGLLNGDILGQLDGLTLYQVKTWCDMQIEKHDGEYFEIYLMHEDHWDSDELQLCGKRMETDDEFHNRMHLTEARELKAVEKRGLEYLRLKKEFENG